MSDIKKRKRFIGFHDMHGNKIYEGDYIKKWWGSSMGVQYNPSKPNDILEEYRFSRVEAKESNSNGDCTRWGVDYCYNRISWDMVERFSKLPKGIKLNEAVTEDNIPHRDLPYTELFKLRAQKFSEDLANELKKSPLIKELRKLNGLEDLK